MTLYAFKWQLDPDSFIVGFGETDLTVM